jgi:hypothetical protein
MPMLKSFADKNFTKLIYNNCSVLNGCCTEMLSERAEGTATTKAISNKWLDSFLNQLQMKSTDLFTWNLAKNSTTFRYKK